MRKPNFLNFGLSLILLLFCHLAVHAQGSQIEGSKIKGHPRLLLLAGEEQRIKGEIAKDANWRKVHEAILNECDLMVDLKPMERNMIGRRLLQSSRESLRRIFFLSYAWRMTQQTKYFKKCEKELLAISNYPDWNPDHFLDVAEMTMAASIGYDWLYNQLSSPSRLTISKAIIEKGLKPSLDTKYNGWLRGSNNWNQVCNGGITFGALAVYEDQPEASADLVNRAIKSILIPMKVYNPSGNYPEGYSYWGYGTSYNVFFIDALEKIFNTDFNLGSQPGFMNTAFFYENLTGTTTLPFNYSDNGGNEGLQPAMFWFANKLKDPGLLFVEQQYLKNLKFNAKSNRFLPAALIWGKGIVTKDIDPPKGNLLAPKATNEIAILRTGWAANDIYVGVKAGTPSLSHAHMDVGSFVMDADGLRWASDFGMQNYNSLESAGLKIWDMTQQSQRWDVFRYNNRVHNTLTVNNHLQQVKGLAKIDQQNAEETNTRVVMDLSSVYSEDLSSAKRGIAILDKRFVVVKDELTNGAKESTVRWTMLTPASVEILDGNKVVLTSKGKKLTLTVEGLDGVTWQKWATDPPNTYDAPNPGTTFVGFEVRLQANSSKEFTVLLIPESAGKKTGIKIKSLNNW